MAKLELIEKNDGKTLEIVITGDFGFSLYEEFYGAWNRLSDASEYVINLTKCTNLQSSALGMLLLMKEQTGDKSIQIISGSPNVDAVIDLAHLERVFVIKKPERPDLQQASTRQFKDACDGSN